jgi:hypothetical protein
LPGLGEGDPARQRAILPQGGAVVPHPPWHRAPSGVTGGWILDVISPPLRNP